jgi:1-deoxy-D-xylulose-5-phosphate reductoisomerase
LFDLAPEQIRVLIHPQSVVHSLVEYVDGSFLAQLGSPDMRTPIAYAMAWPERMHAGVAPLDFTQLAALQFEAPDLTRYPCLELAYQALHQGGSAPAVLNAANEVAVAAFLERRIPFTAIAHVVADALAQLDHRELATLDELLQHDAETRAFAHGRLPFYGS